jgi:septal ring factor EnvC (AmiA/AmiB activator)
MTDKTPSLEQRLEQLEQGQAKLLEMLTAIDSRIEILHQEFQRTATTVSRFSLAQESAKLHNQRLESFVSEVRGKLTKLAAALDKKP